MSFRREKFIDDGRPRRRHRRPGRRASWPNAQNALNTLIDYRYQQHFKAKKGENGKGSCRTGESARTIWCWKVPLGTEILADDKETVDCRPDDRIGQTVVTLLHGGRGGAGQRAFQKLGQPRTCGKSTPSPVSLPKKCGYGCA